MSPIAPECGPDGTFCPLGAHAVTGWCLAASGDPVLVVTTLTCPPGDPASGVTVTLIDPATGNVVAPQPIIPCGGQDWEVNQLCDYDVDGNLIATFLQVFEWEEDSGSVQISLVRADDPQVPYAPSGEVRACASDSPVITRGIDGDYQVGAGTITIPDGVLSFAVTVLSGGNTTTIDGPDFAGPVTLHNGQSIGHSADDDNLIRGPITVTVPAGAIVNSTWVVP